LIRYIRHRIARAVAIEKQRNCQNESITALDAVCRDGRRKWAEQRRTSVSPSNSPAAIAG
jgi:hypothetical protein